MAKQRTPAKRKPKRKAPKRKAPQLRFDAKRLLALLPAARRGDAHAILGLDPKISVRKALDDPPEWATGSLEKLLALYVAADTFGHDLNGVIYDFAEHTYFRYDDDGYGLADVNCNLGVIHMLERFDLVDEAKAKHYFESALAGPYPEGVREELAKALAMTKQPFPTLKAL